MVSADAQSYLADTDTILGVVMHNEARAYPHNILWWHEIYNDSIAGTEFSVTLCPLTGSGMVFAGQHKGEAVDFGVSGNLFNSNLVMFDRQNETLWSQMMLQGISGPGAGDALTLWPVVETTWGRWKELYPQTLVVSDTTGHSRDYGRYPYGSYRSDHGNTFRPVDPRYADHYQAKDLVLALVGTNTRRAYAYRTMADLGDRVLINDVFEDIPIVIIYEAEHAMAVPFVALADGKVLTFEGVP